MYERSRTVVRCAVGQTEEFNVEVGLHQGSALSPFLFAIVMDQLSEEVRQESPWTMMFADDIVICSESREQVEENLERWRFALERRGMKVSRSKTEYMCVNEREGSGTVRLQGEEVKKVQEFKYLGSTVQKRVQAGWNGWRKVSEVLCDRKISARIKGKVYRTVVRAAMLYGLETVSLRKRQESELEVAELKMLSKRLAVWFYFLIISILKFPPLGVRLDYRSCESLEEILKSVRFNLINLQGAELEEHGASSLMDMISYYDSATHLDVSCNKSMGVSGWQALSRLLIQKAASHFSTPFLLSRLRFSDLICIPSAGESRSLWRLDACNIPIEDYPAQALSRALLSSRLTILHLENTGLSGKPLFTLVCALKKNIALQELYLCDNELNSFHDSMQLGELLKYNRTLLTLDLSNNAVSDSGLEELCDGLRVQKSGLRTLVLHNNRITHHGMTHLGCVLPLLRTLETLDLSANDLEDRGLHALKEALISNRSISRLNLASVRITCEGAVVLAEFLAESRFLQSLDVRQNLVLTGGLMAFALALKLNRTLIHLDLDQNPKEEKLPCTYRICPTFHVSLLKLAHEPHPDNGATTEPPPTLEIDGAPAYQ
ncbi:hypothetical protein QTP70_022440, partial [Hemibagrus guttatus]